MLPRLHGQRYDPAVPMRFAIDVAPLGPLADRRHEAGRAAPRRRLGRWVAAVVDESGGFALQPAELGERVRRIVDLRAATGRGDDPFDVAVFALSQPDDSVADWATAGTTWWLESLSPTRGPIDELLARIEAGPPSLD